ncbi:MAG TPA: hypothetical protein VKH15_02030 [Candidatus Acidoferrum sp.]|nr:hypothetical protein [Candidatus Acidoferrum sp.]
MRGGYGYFGLIVGTGALFGVMTVGGCGQQSPTVVYDANHRDNHKWDDREDSAYRRWEAENHKDHQDFAKRQAEEQNDYWNWRHSHPG